MKYWQWYITDEITGKRRLTRWKMTREQALSRYPDAEPDLRTEEQRSDDPPALNTLPPGEKL